MVAVTHALEKALGVWSDSREGEVADFLRQATTELLYVTARTIAGLAIVTGGTGGVRVVARPRGVPALPDATLRSFLDEIVEVRGVCKVKDHALDTVRFIDGHFRTSVVVTGRLPKELGVGSEMMVWAGLVAGATPKVISEIQALACELSRWLEGSSMTLLSIIESRRRIREARQKLGEMTSVAHDVRAPLAALSYLLNDVARAHGGVAEDVRAIQVELSYISTLMEKFSPATCRETKNVEVSCNVVMVLRRVSERFSYQARELGVSFVWDVQCQEVSARIDPVALERALTNIVGNAIKYSESAEVKLRVAIEDSQVKVCVVDRGVGIPQRVLDHLSLAAGGAEAALESIRASAGWGVGLLATKSLIERAGGRLQARSSSGETSIEVEVARSANSLRDEQIHHNSFVCSRAPQYGGARLVIIDDDTQHSASLARTLSRAGLVAESFDSVDVALAYLQAEPEACVVCDARMPDGGAERVLRALRMLRSGQLVAVMSGDADDDSLYRFAALDAAEFFPKPVNVERLVAWVNSIHRSHEGETRTHANEVITKKAAGSLL